MIRPSSQSWHAYALALLAFNLVGFVFVYAVLRLQGVLPLNPQGFPGLSGTWRSTPPISFVTNTNWQSYAGETTMSTLSQMLVLTVQNFVSAATGATVAAPPWPGRSSPIAARASVTSGPTWFGPPSTCCCRCAFVVAIVLVALGLPQTLAAGVTATTLEGAEQKISLYRCGQRRRRSRCWASTVAASSTPTPPIRSRIPRR